MPVAGSDDNQRCWHPFGLVQDGLTNITRICQDDRVGCGNSHLGEGAEGLFHEGVDTARIFKSELLAFDPFLCVHMDEVHCALVRRASSRAARNMGSEWLVALTATMMVKYKASRSLVGTKWSVQARQELESEAGRRHYDPEESSHE
jgi:hypothetical protein